jgi:hypothetical protein
LCDLGEALLGLVNQEFGPELQLLADGLQRLGVVVGQFDLFPHGFGRVSALNGFDVQVKHAVVLMDGGVSTVGQRARTAVAQTGDVVLILAEILLQSSERKNGNMKTKIREMRRDKRNELDLEGAKVLVDNLPNNFVCGRGSVRVRSALFGAKNQRDIARFSSAFCVPRFFCFFFGASFLLDFKKSKPTQLGPRMSGTVMI